MKLLLDEHYSPKIADELRTRGHDVVSVKQRGDLRAIDDRELWRRAAAEGRALVTENVGDFMPLVRQAAAAGDRHFGIVFTSPRSMPRTVATIGRDVTELDRLLRGRVEDDALADQVHWLSS